MTVPPLAAELAFDGEPTAQTVHDPEEDALDHTPVGRLLSPESAGLVTVGLGLYEAARHPAGRDETGLYETDGVETAAPPLPQTVSRTATGDDDSVYPSIRLARVAPSPFDIGLDGDDSDVDAFASEEADGYVPIEHRPGEDFEDPRNPYDLDFKRRWLVPLAAGLASLLAVGLAVWVVVDNATSDDEPEAATTVAVPIEVGSYVGLAVADIEAELEANGWEPAVTERRQDGTESGLIIDQRPQAGEPLAPGATIDLTVSLGPELRPVPDLRGLTVEDASSTLRSAQLELGVVTRQHDDEMAEGEVLTARIGGAEATAEAEPGTAVDLVVSAGPVAEPMPSFVGLTLANALNQADGLGLVVTQAEAFTEVYDEGFIVDTTPPTNTPVRPGDQLTLVVSLGPPFITVPDVSGLDPAGAANVLAEAGFTVTDSQGPPNLPVIATTPGAGESQRKGSPVVVHTSIS